MLPYYQIFSQMLYHDSPCTAGAYGFILKGVRIFSFRELMFVSAGKSLVYYILELIFISAEAYVVQELIFFMLIYRGVFAGFIHHGFIFYLHHHGFIIYLQHFIIVSAGAYVLCSHL